MGALQLTGSTTLLPNAARGYKALLDGTTDIAMASGSAPDDLRTAAAARNTPLRATVVSRDAILALVHASNPLATLRLSAARADDAGDAGCAGAAGGPLHRRCSHDRRGGDAP